MTKFDRRIGESRDQYLARLQGIIDRKEETEATKLDALYWTVMGMAVFFLAYLGLI